MGFFGALAPLYLLGLAAISLPLIFHLIRRTPSGEVSFSSLMFLQPSPPRITRRSRLDNILLLILRGLVLCLLAFAFTRPLWRQGMSLDLSGVRNRQVAIVVDVSASMQRDGVWTDSMQEVDRILESLEEGDQVALFAYDETLRPVVDYDDTLPGLEDQLRRVRAAASDLSPGWHKTDLPNALTKVADHVLATALQKQSDKRPLSQVYLVSDLQPGNDLSDLQGYEWPTDVLLDIRWIKPKQTDNAGLRLLYGETAGQNLAYSKPRVRVTNTADSQVEQFTLHWVLQDGRIDEGTSYLVPEGETRVVRISDGPLFAENDSDRAVSVRLVGEKAEFDNEFYVATPRQETFRVAYLGPNDVDDRETIPYFLSRALIDSPRRAFDFTKWDEGLPIPATAGDVNAAPDDQINWVVVAQPLDSNVLQSVVEFAERGGRVLVVLTDASMQIDLAKYLKTDVQISEAGQDDFALMSYIDFQAPLFRPFADPRFSNFTGIHFWNHRIVEFSDESGEGYHVIASFDDNSPMLIQSPAGDGVINVLTSSWLPSESQLALSSKFLPLIAGLAGDQSRQNQRLYFDVGDAVDLPDAVQQSQLEIDTPDGTTVAVEEGETVFDDTDRPGRYRVRGAGAEYTFAVNVAASESNTAPMKPESLEQFGIKLGDQPEQREQVAWERDLRDRELESRQKIWSWLIVAATMLVLAEMFVAGRIQQQRAAANPIVEPE